MGVLTGSPVKLSYDDYLLLPDDNNVHEIIDGEHYMSASPSTYHQTVSRRLQFLLYEAIELSDGGVVFNAPTDVQLSDYDVVVPDIFVIRASRTQMISPSRVLGPPRSGHRNHLSIERQEGSRDQAAAVRAVRRAGVLGGGYGMPHGHALSARRRTLRSARAAHRFDRLPRRGDRRNRRPAARLVGATAAIAASLTGGGGVVRWLMPREFRAVHSSTQGD